MGKDFNWSIPENYNFVDVLRRWAEDKSKLSVIVEHVDGRVEKATYWEILDNAARLGNVFRSLGVYKGDRVLILLPRGIEAYVARFGTWIIGGVAVPGTVMLRRWDIEYRIRDCEPKVIVVGDPVTASEVDAIRDKISLKHFIIVGEDRRGWINFWDVIRSASRKIELEEIKANDVLTINYTSGTTGPPKGVVRTHDWMYCILKIHAEYWWRNVKPSDLCWVTAEPGWAKWEYAVLGVVFNVGATNFHYTGRFNPEIWFNLLDKWRINIAKMTATELRAMCTVSDADRKYDLSSLKFILSAGEPVTPKIVKFFKEMFGVDVREGYGQTETCITACVPPDTKIKPGSMGKFVPMVDAAIVNPETGLPVGVGEVGVIAIKKGHPTIFKGYWGRHEEKCYIGEWYLTGDMAKMDEDGYIWFEGRSDDVIKSSGYRIGPFEVENIINSHPAVLESAVVASPDPLRGAIVKAYVVLKPGYKPSEELIRDIQDYCKKIAAPYKYPREIEFIDELPKTISGKIKRFELRKRELEKKSK